MGDTNRLIQLMWSASNIMHSVGCNDAIEVFLGVFFYKWLCDSRARIGWKINQEDDWQTLRVYQQDIVQKLQTATRQIENNNEVLEGLFDRYLFSKLGQLRPEAIWMIINAIDRIDSTDVPEATSQFIEHYLTWMVNLRRVERISTPLQIADLIVSLSSADKAITVCDVGSGVGNILARVNAINSNAILYGQEISWESVALSKINLLLHNTQNFTIICGDILRDPKLIEGKELMQFDVVFSDLPVNSSNWGVEEAEIDRYGRFKYGVPRQRFSHWAFIQHILTTTKNKALILTTRGPLFRDNEIMFRNGVLNDDLLEAIIDLPQKLYNRSSIPVSIIVFNRNKKSDRHNRVIFIDASKEYKQKSRGQNIITPANIQRIVEAYQTGKNEEGFCRSVSLKEIKQNGSRLICDIYIRQTSINTVLQNAIPLEMLTSKIFRGLQLPAKEINELMNQSQKGYFLLNIGDIRENRINKESLQEIGLTSDQWKKLYLLLPGDVVLSGRGTTIKTTVVEKDSLSLILGGNLLCIRPDRKKLDPYYLKAFLDSPIGRASLERIQTGSVIIALNPNKLRTLKIPMQPIAKQIQIGRKYADIMDKYHQALHEANNAWEIGRKQIFQEIDCND